MTESNRRLFVAVDLPESVRDRLSALSSAHPELARQLRWARQDGLHVTLRFLGPTPTETCEAIDRSLGALKPVGAFELTLAGLALFGTVRRPRVLHVEVGGDLDRLGLLQREVEAAAVAAGFEPETRPFVPHVTLARARPGFTAGEALSQLLSRHGGDRFGSFRVSSFVLYRSQLQPEGSVYTPLRRYQLD